MGLSVLLIIGEVARAARLQRRLHEEGIPSYWAISEDNVWRALRDVAPGIIVVNHATAGNALSFFALLADARPHVHRLLLVHVPASLFARERGRGLVDEVIYEKTLVRTISTLMPVEARRESDDADDRLGTVLSFTRT